ncbi:MAG: metallophosphoesterase [Acidimicrobiales bacterium]|nr:metallophosphoesterase [Acidimicrobiales bacterium]
MKRQGYDVIGDVHGHADKLVSLLVKMGYEDRDGSWRHSDRQAVFVGDLVDRGPKQLETVSIARSMVACGSALITAGNHEFNAVAWRFGHRKKSPKNRRQHMAFLTEVGEGSAVHDELIEWFMTLPLWLDLGGLRVVHACWDPASIALLAEQVGPGNSLTADLVKRATKNGSPEWRTVEHLLKGPEVSLAPYPAYLDSGGEPRKRARWKWWDSNALSLRSGVVLPANPVTATGDPYPVLPDEPLRSLPVTLYTDEIPVIYGHFWETGTPKPSSRFTACVDYSAGKGGPLVAYRWSGEKQLTAENFASS